jgi:glucose-6-phosphate 1-dehydrogenase
MGRVMFETLSSSGKEDWLLFRMFPFGVNTAHVVVLGSISKAMKTGVIKFSVLDKKFIRNAEKDQLLIACRDRVVVFEGCMNRFVLVLLLWMGFLEAETVPSVIVIFGATGDLTARKVMPALYNLAQDGNLSENTVVVGVGRKQYTDLSFRAQMREGVDKFSRTKTAEEAWGNFEKKLFYTRVNFDSEEGYEGLHRFLLKIDREFGTQGNRIFYLATHPSAVAPIVEKLHQYRLIYDVEATENKWSRVVIEKPFGTDLDSAIQLQAQIGKFLDESQIYRIDHYLGKAGVQNLYTLRFENVLFEPIWNNRYIDHVQMTISEQMGIGSRGSFWEETGLLGDVFQNHLLQLLSLVAMEPPRSSSHADIHREKMKLLNAIRPFPHEEIDKYVVRGQYSSGKVDGAQVPGYRQEKNVADVSTIETFVAAKVFIDNERWKGVPFYLRSGKRLAAQTAEIVVTFKENNALVIRIQPDPGVFFRMVSKVPEIGRKKNSVVMGYQLGTHVPEAYESLLYDCILGDHRLFVDADEQIAAWRLLTPVVEHWKTFVPKKFPNYSAGTWGPEEANMLIDEDGRKWEEAAISLPAVR